MNRKIMDLKELIDIGYRIFGAQSYAYNCDKIAKWRDEGKINVEERKELYNYNHKLYINFAEIENNQETNVINLKISKSYFAIFVKLINYVYRHKISSGDDKPIYQDIINRYVSLLEECGFTVSISNDEITVVNNKNCEFKWRI